MGDNRKHSELGASISHRWIECPGSVRLSRGQKQTDNVHAQAGRAAHTVAEQCLTYGGDADRYLGDMVKVADGEDGPVLVEVTEEMVYAVQMFVDYCRLTLRSVQGERHWVEKQFNLSAFGRDDMFGTTDFASYNPAPKQLEVVDLKYGQGVVVEAVGNPQLRYYALGAALELGKLVEIETVKITIVQPRASHPDGFIRSETLSLMELLDFAGELMVAAEKTDAPDAPLVPGSHCRFCPALAVCPAQRKQAQALAQVAFADMPVSAPPEPSVLPDEVLGDLLSKTPILVDWVGALQKEAEHRLLAGRNIPGMKLVEKRPTRKWVDEEKIVAFLKGKGLFDEEIYQQKLKSPAQIEKLVGKKELPTDLVEKKSSGYKLAPSSDPSPAIAAGPQVAFAALPPADAE